MKRGFVYLLSCEQGYTKIGQSINPDRRFRRLHKKYKFKWDVICVLPSVNCWHMESQLHTYFSAKRIKGWKDWFNLTPGDVEYIKGVVR